MYLWTTIVSGPRPATVLDMWRMIWELNTNRIVMLTRETENGKVMCYQPMFFEYIISDRKDLSRVQLFIFYGFTLLKSIKQIVNTRDVCKTLTSRPF